MSINDYLYELLKKIDGTENHKGLLSLIKELDFNNYDMLEYVLNKLFSEKLDIRINGKGKTISLTGTGESLTLIIAMIKHISIIVKHENINKKEIIDLFKYFLNK